MTPTQPSDGLKTDAPSASYGALLRVPGFARVVTGSLLARLSGQMWEIVLVLFVLQRYRSTTLAGVTVLLAIFPGLLLSPVAGALLDRQGRVRLMILDYSLTAALSAAIALLSLQHHLPPALLLAIVAVLAVSNILSITGTRSLFPLMLPRRLWDRANGMDSSVYSLTAIVGPAVAGLVVARFGPEAGLLLIAAVVGSAALSLLGVREPVARTTPSRSLASDSWAALTYVVRHRSLRGLALTLFVSNIGFGVLPVGIPVIVLRRLHGTAATVGQVWALFGVAGLIAGLLFGRINTDGRERLWIAGSILVQVPTLVALAFVNQLAVVLAVAVLGGVCTAVGNIGTFALRQRRTAPPWFGRAFAVSMSMNYSGQPIGSALSGPLLERSIAVPFLLGAAINVAAAVIAIALIPRRHAAPDGLDA